MAIFQIPLTNNNEVFEINLAGTDYLLTSKWNPAPEGGWTLDFVNAQTNASVAANVPLITGGNILEGLDYLGFNGSLFVFTDGNPDAVPTFTNLGVESNLYFQTVIT